MIIPGVPPSISLNSASNSRQGGRPTSKVFNNYSFDILGLRIISSTIYLTGSLFGFVNQKLRPTLFKTTFSQRWRWHQRGDPLGARPALVWQVDLYSWSSIWVEIYVLGYILLIFYLSWEQIEWSGSWVFYSNPFSQLHLFSTFTTCPLSILNPFQQNSWTGFALQLLGQSLDFRSWSNEEKCKINMDRGATDYFMNLKFSHLSLTKVSQLWTSGPIDRSPGIPGSTSPILFCWWLIKTTCGK